MRHRQRKNITSGSNEYQKALTLSLIKAMVEHEKIKTTAGRAPILKMELEKLVTLAKVSNLHTRRQILKKIPPKLAHKLLTVIAPRYQSRKGGYLRVMNAKNRVGDNAKMVIIEFV